MELVINVPETLGQCLYLRSETVFKYEDNKRTTKVDGVKVYVLSTAQQAEIAVKVDIQHEPSLPLMTQVEFEGVEIKPYVKKSGNFATLEYAIKADNILKAQ